MSSVGYESYCVNCGPAGQCLSGLFHGLWLQSSGRQTSGICLLHLVAGLEWDWEWCLSPFGFVMSQLMCHPWNLPHHLQCTVFLLLMNDLPCLYLGLFTLVCHADERKFKIPADFYRGRICRYMVRMAERLWQIVWWHLHLYYNMNAICIACPKLILWWRLHKKNARELDRTNKPPMYPVFSQSHSLPNWRQPCVLLRNYVHRLDSLQTNN